MVHGLDQLFIDDEVPIGDDVEWVELVEIPPDARETKSSTKNQRLYFCSLKNKSNVEKSCTKIVFFSAKKF